MAINRASVLRLLHLVPLVVAGTVLAGCASVSIPFTSLGSSQDDGLVTGSVGTPAELGPSQTPMPPPLATAVTAPEQAPLSEPQTASNPTETLVASVEATQNRPLAFTQSDLDALGTKLTAELERDPAIGTFPWSVEASGLSGVMTPFRVTSGGAEACRIVSIEVSGHGREAIVLADACHEAGAYVLVNPKAGQVL